MMAIDPCRLRRAVFLDLERVDTDTYRVFEGASAHIVTLDHGCDCADHNWRGQENCKHVLRVLLDQGEAGCDRGTAGTGVRN